MNLLERGKISLASSIVFKRFKKLMKVLSFVSNKHRHFV